MDSNVLHRTLGRLDELYEMKKRFLAPRMKLAFSEHGKTEDYELGVYVYYIPQTGVLVVLFERNPSSGRVIVQMTAKEHGPWAWSDMKESARTEEAALSALDEEIQASREPPPYGGTFRCPICHAIYNYSNLELSDDGLVQCQNCAAWVAWRETSAEASPTSNDS